MSIQLAFSTVACPEWSLEQTLARAEEFGYTGLELRTLGPGGTQLAGDPALSDPAKIAALFQSSAVKPVCLSTSECLHHRDTTKAHQAMWRIRAQLELAAAVGAPMVRIFGHEIAPGESRRSVIGRIAERVVPLADRAGELGLRLVFENGGSFAAAKDWWTLFNLVEHPLLKLCWNVANAAAAGETPATSVPMLNSRIALAKVKDLKIGAGSGYVQLGDGDCQIQHYLRRLMGIGFDGFVTVEWDRAWLPTLAPAEEILPEAARRLKAWIEEIQQATDAGAKSLAKNAAKNAPRRRAETK